MKISLSKHLLLFSVIFIQMNNSFAQDAAVVPITVKITTKETGRNLLNQSPVTATVHDFPDRIHSFKLDTATGSMMVELRGTSKNGKWLDNKGTAIRYDLKNNKILWTEKIAYQTESITPYNRISVITSGGKSFCLDNESGKQLWQNQHPLLYADTYLNTGIGYKSNAKKKAENLLEGINLKDGSVLWQREISREYGWNDILKSDDSTILIVADGLHSLSLKDGKGWDYNARTALKDYTKSTVGTGLGIAAGLLTGMYAVSTGHDVIRNLSSNVLADSLHLYFAAKESLVKLDKNGNIIWKTGLPEEQTSKSRIFKYGTNIILVNLGYANLGQNKTSFGKPFISSFNSNSGLSNFMNVLTTGKENIQDFRVANTEIIIMFTDRLEKYSLETGKLLTAKKYNQAEDGQLSYFLENKLFLKEGTGFKALTTSGPQQYFIYTSNGKIILADHSLELKDKFAYENLYISYRNIKKTTLIGNQKESILIDRSGKSLAELPGSYRTIVFNDKLYIPSDHELLEIDLTPFTLNH